MLDILQVMVLVPVSLVFLYNHFGDRWEGICIERVILNEYGRRMN